jgi:hypothetical protein
LQLFVDAVDPLALRRSFNLNYVGFTIDQGSEKVPRDEFDLHFACEERGVMGWKSVWAES